MTTRYQQQSNRLGEDRHLGGRFKAGLLAPVMAHKVEGSEGGMLTQRAFFELDPIPGRMMSTIYGEVISVYVPLQAIHALKNPTADYPGSNDVIRAALADGDSITALETENELSQRLGINPIAVSGVKKVDESARLAYICAVNMLRQRKYVKASLALSSETAMLPAILSKTVLERLNGVLDPEDRVDGAINLSGEIPVRGIGFNGDPTVVTASMRQTEGAVVVPHMNSGVDPVEIQTDDSSGAIRPSVWADLGLGSTDISLRDFYRAERMDLLTRKMREFVDANPTQGEEIVARWAAGLSLDIGREPFVMYERKVALNNQVERPMDGANIDNVRTYPVNGLSFTVPIPATEFGGVVITMMAVKPDEVLSSQPHPRFTKPWAARNFAADELAIDPVPVLMRELDSDVDLADEDTTAMYIGNNGLERMYRQYGWNRELDTLDVAAQTSIWQLEVPASVTPETVNYPSPLPQTPFADTTAEVCTYGIKTMLTLGTPVIFGPNPVEELAAIEDEDIFEDAGT